MYRLLIALIVGAALLAAGCSSDDSAGVVILGTSGDSITMSGTWEGCSVDGTDSFFIIIEFTAGSTAITGTFEDHTGVMDCSSLGGTDDFTGTISPTGSKTVSWETPPGNPGGLPNSLTGTKFMISIVTGGGTDTGLDVGVVDDESNPRTLYTSDENESHADSDGYPQHVSMYSPLVEQ